MLVLYKLLYSDIKEQTIVYVEVDHVEFCVRYLTRYIQSSLIENDINNNIIRCVNANHLPVTLND